VDLDIKGLILYPEETETRKYRGGVSL